MGSPLRRAATTRKGIGSENASLAAFHDPYPAGRPPISPLETPRASDPHSCKDRTSQQSFTTRRPSITHDDSSLVTRWQVPPTIPWAAARAVDNYHRRQRATIQSLLVLDGPWTSPEPSSSSSESSSDRSPSWGEDDDEIEGQEEQQLPSPPLDSPTPVQRGRSGRRQHQQRRRRQRAATLPRLPPPKVVTRPNLPHSFFSEPSLSIADAQGVPPGAGATTPGGLSSPDSLATTGGTGSRLRARSVRTPDRFVPMRDADVLATTTATTAPSASSPLSLSSSSAAAERFRTTKPYGLLSGVERLLRHAGQSDDPFMATTARGRRISANGNAAGARVGGSEGGGAGARRGDGRRTRGSGGTVLGVLPNNHGPLEREREASNGTVWTVGGIAPGGAVDDGRGHLVRSGTHARLFTTTFSASQSRPSDELEYHEGRLASALDIDRVLRVLNFGGVQHQRQRQDGGSLARLPFSGSRTRPASYPNHGTMWDGSAWTSTAVLETRKRPESRSLPSAPFKVLDAPNLRDDFYCSVLAYSPTCHTLAVALGNLLYAWSEASGVTPLNVGLGDRTYITSVAFSSAQGGRSILAFGRSNGVLALLSLYDSLVPRLEFNTACPVASLSWRPTCTARPSASPSNPGVLVATEDLLVGDDSGFVDYYVVEWPAAWEVARDGWPGCVTLVARVAVHTQQICGLAWSPDGAMFASGGNDNLCCLFDVESVLVPEPESEGDEPVVGFDHRDLSGASASTVVTHHRSDAGASAATAATGRRPQAPQEQAARADVAGYRFRASPPMRLSTLFDLGRGDRQQQLDERMAGLAMSSGSEPATPRTESDAATLPTTTTTTGTPATPSDDGTTSVGASMPSTGPSSPRRTIRILGDASGQPRQLRPGSERHRIVHGAAVKAIAWCPWLPGLVATGGGSNDRCIHFHHARSGAALATIAVSAQVTALVWSRSRREIAATFGYASPEHPVRIAVFAWPACRQVAAVPWDSVGELRALSAVAYPLVVRRGAGGGGGDGDREFSVGRYGTGRERARQRGGGSAAGPHVVEDGCIVVAASDESVKFHEVWPEEPAGRDDHRPVGGGGGGRHDVTLAFSGDDSFVDPAAADYNDDDDDDPFSSGAVSARGNGRPSARTRARTTTATGRRRDRDRDWEWPDMPLPPNAHLGAAGVGMLGGSDILEDLEGIDKEGDIIR